LTGNNNGQIYAWDIENRLTTATDSQNNTLGTYTYDALGRRVSKTVGANTTVFVSDGLQKICEYENGTLARAYAYGSYVDEPLVMISGVNKYYYHSNNLYSVAALTDAAGSVIERYKYDPYGKATILAADGITTRTVSIVSNPFQYDGYYHDTETGLEFVNARYYSSDLGRFIARDPLDYADGFGLYEYCTSSPVGEIDPTGCSTKVPGTPYRIVFEPPADGTNVRHYHVLDKNGNRIPNATEKVNGEKHDGKTLDDSNLSKKDKAKIREKVAQEVKDKAEKDERRKERMLKKAERERVELEEIEKEKEEEAVRIEFINDVRCGLKVIRVIKVIVQIAEAGETGGATILIPLILGW
jgi:RHS repeat-associated protein